MNPGPSSRPPDTAKPIDDFEWPPTADDLSVYEIGPDPWQKVQEASSEVLAARRGPLTPRSQPAPGTRQTLTGVVAAAVIVATAAGWALYSSMTRPVAVRAVHHPAPAPTTAAPAAPPRSRAAPASSRPIRH
jgi:hypothetical protein